MRPHRFSRPLPSDPRDHLAFWLVLLGLFSLAQGVAALVRWWQGGN